MRVVVDTNILVAALLSPHGPPAQVVRLAVQGDVAVLHDDRILGEYRDVLSRPKFGFDPDDVEALLRAVESGGEAVFSRPIPVELPDPDDLPFLEVAVAGVATALITGNDDHCRPVRGRHDVNVVSPRTFIDSLAEGEDVGPD